MQTPGTGAAVQVGLGATPSVTASRTLTTSGPLPGATTTVQALNSAVATPANGLLAAVAAQIGKRCTAACK